LFVLEQAAKLIYKRGPSIFTGESMPQSEENLGRTTIFRREDTVPVSVQEEFGHYLVVIGGAGLGRRLRLGDVPLVIGRESQCGSCWRVRTSRAAIAAWISRAVRWSPPIWVRPMEPM